MCNALMLTRVFLAALVRPGFRFLGVDPGLPCPDKSGLVRPGF